MAEEVKRKSCLMVDDLSSVGNTGGGVERGDRKHGQCFSQKLPLDCNQNRAFCLL
jgi:hypothetical protein